MSLLNRTQLRKFILRKVQELRPGMPLTRVSSSVLDQYESLLMSMIRGDIEVHPSRGKTFMDSAAYHYYTGRNK